MGVYRRTDSDTYWMSLVIDGQAGAAGHGGAGSHGRGRNLRGLASAGGPSPMAGAPRTHPDSTRSTNS